MQKYLYFYFPFMQSAKIIRAYQLKKDDRFILLGREYKVFSNDGKTIRFGLDNHYKLEMGSRSQELVRLITDETNFDNNKQNKNGNQDQFRSVPIACASCVFNGFGQRPS